MWWNVHIGVNVDVHSAQESFAELTAVCECWREELRLMNVSCHQLRVSTKTRALTYTPAPTVLQREQKAKITPRNNKDFIAGT